MRVRDSLTDNATSNIYVQIEKILKTMYWLQFLPDECFIVGGHIHSFLQFH